MSRVDNCYSPTITGGHTLQSVSYSDTASLIFKLKVFF